MKNVGETIKAFFVSRSKGFYVGASAALLSFITSIVYVSLYTAKSRMMYISWGTFVFLLIGFIAFAALAAFKVTERFASGAVAITSLAAFLCYVQGIYMYFSQVFYAGVNANAFKAIDGGVYYSFVSFIILLVLSAVGIFLGGGAANKEAVKKRAPVLVTVSKALAVAFSFIFGVTLVGSDILLANTDAVNGFLHAETQKIINESNDGADTDYYKSAFRNVESVRINGAAFCEAVEAEGAVLLKNENGALPLGEGAKVSLFSCSSVDPFYTGNGSGGSSGNGGDELTSTDLKNALEEAGLEINQSLYDFYESHLGIYGRKRVGAVVDVRYSIGDAKWADLPQAAKTNPDYGDAAIFVLSRGGGEGRDLTMYGGDADDYTDGDYLKLSPTEADVLSNLKLQKDAGVYKKIIVLMNSANQVQCDFVDKAEYGIDALAWVGLFGSTGAYAVGDLLVGNINFSGRLSTTFWKQHYLNPVHNNFGLTVDESNEHSGSGGHWSSNVADIKNAVYQEGMYVGYRYTETRYEDKVLGNENAGDYNWSDVVSYPFGYGLSYTTFDYSNFTSSYDSENDVYTFSVDVTNSGARPGKEVVQIYLQKPYTDYDREHRISKPSAELVGFEKTEIIDPGDSQTVSIEVDGRERACYDAYGAGTYVLENGEYLFTVAKDAHNAVNNILEYKGKSAADGMIGSGESSFVAAETVGSFDSEIYSVADATKNKIVNRFDDTDLKRYDGAGPNATKFEYLNRDNWAGTVVLGLTADGKRTNMQVRVTPTAKMQEDKTKDKGLPEKDSRDYPVYGAEHKYNLIDLRAYYDGDGDPTNDTPIPYDDPMWTDLLNQLTWDETVGLVTRGLRMTAGVASIAKPETIDHNGGTGPVMSYNVGGSVNNGLAVRTDDPNKGMTPVTYTCNGIVGATFNKTLADYYGRQWGEDCLWSGLAGLYGMGVNIQRSPYGGRNFEYFSEDPVLMGDIAAAMTRGMGTRGAYAYLKHCVLNDQETYRGGIMTWANEQTICEIYLKPFQIAIENGGAQCVMTGFNCLGVKWTGSHGFANTVLRGEFGMSGHAVSDMWFDVVPGVLWNGILNGNDIPDGTLDADTLAFAKNGGYGELAWAMRESAHRVLYTVVHSNAMNTFSANTRVIFLTPKWIKAVNGVSITVYVLFACVAAMLVASIVLYRLGIIKSKEKKPKLAAAATGRAVKLDRALYEQMKAEQEQSRRKIQELESRLAEMTEQMSKMSANVVEPKAEKLSGDEGTNLSEKSVQKKTGNKSTKSK